MHLRPFIELGSIELQVVVSGHESPLSRNCISEAVGKQCGKAEGTVTHDGDLTECMALNVGDGPLPLRRVQLQTPRFVRL